MNHDGTPMGCHEGRNPFSGSEHPVVEDQDAGLSGEDTDALKKDDFSVLSTRWEG